MWTQTQRDGKQAARLFSTISCTLLAGLVLAGRARAADSGKMEAAKPDAVKPQPAAKPDKNALKASTVAVQAAIAALQKEAAAHASDAKTPLRDKCNYFTENAPKDPILPETIVQSLLTTFSPDSPTDSYIKWQLLSGAPAKFDESLAHQAVTAYAKAGKPITRPGLAAADKKQLDPLLKDIKTADDAAKVSKKLGDLVDPWEKRNEPVLAYRDELYSRLPVNGESLVARLEDDTQRVEAGYESEKEMKITTDAIAKWADTNPPSAHITIVANQVKAWISRETGKGGSAAGTGAGAGMGKGGYGKYGGNYGGNYGQPAAPTFPPKYYQDIEFDSKANKWQWADRGARQIRKETLDELVVTLEETATTAKKNEMTKK